MKNNSLVQRVKRRIQNSNGIDAISKDVIYSSLFINILNIFIRNGFLSLIPLVGVGYVLFRMFSNNPVKRGIENRNYLTVRNNITNSFNKKINRLKDNKDYKYFKCLNCGQQLRVPRRQGKIEVHCPKCGATFDKRS